MSQRVGTLRIPPCATMAPRYEPSRRESSIVCPSRRDLRVLISVVCLLHLLMVVDGLEPPLRFPPSAAWLRWTQTAQKWRMFQAPRPGGGVPRLIRFEMHTDP